MRSVTTRQTRTNNPFNPLELMETTQETAARRVCIDRREKAAESRKRLARELCNTANELAEAYASLKIGAFTAEALAEAVRGRYDTAKRIYTEQAQVEADGMHSVMLRDEVMKSAQEFRNAYSERVEAVRRWTNSEYVMLAKYLTVTDEGRVLFTDEGANALEDNTAVWLDDPEQIAKYERHKEIIRLLNDFFADGRALPVGWMQLFPLWNGKFVMPDGGANYAWLVARGGGSAQDEAGQWNEQPEEPQQQESGEQPEKPEPKQRNRQRGGMAKGVSKMPDYVEHTEGRRKRY